MKNLISTLFLFVLCGYVNAQNDQFRADFNHVALMLNSDKDWSEWFDAQNTFVFNSNENNDIIHYRANGDVLIYRNLGGLISDFTDTGEHYQILNMLDEDGNQISFQLFDDISIGVKLITSEGMVQFSNF